MIARNTVIDEQTIRNVPGNIPINIMRAIVKATDIKVATIDLIIII